MLPALSVLFAVFAAAVPWGLPADATFILPLVVVMMVFCWRALPGTVLPSYVAMLLGLLTDITSGGPLGFLGPDVPDRRERRRSGAVADRRPRRPQALAGLGRRWRAWSAVLGWLLASLYFLRWIDWWPIAFGALASIALFPVVLHGVLWIRRGRLLPERTALYRRWT